MEVKPIITGVNNTPPDGRTEQKRCDNDPHDEPAAQHFRGGQFRKDRHGNVGGHRENDQEGQFR
jgi:hypothetical protein